MGRRRDEYDDEDDRVGKPPRGGLPPGVWVLRGVAVVGAVMLFGAIALTAGRQVETRPAQTEPATGVIQKPTRDEFKKLVLGKTPDEVLKAVGKPSSRADDNGGERWFFVDPCYDPVSGSTDHWVPVIFRNGRVSEVQL